MEQTKTKQELYKLFNKVYAEEQAKIVVDLIVDLIDDEGKQDSNIILNKYNTDTHENDGYEMTTVVKAFNSIKQRLTFKPNKEDVEKELDALDKKKQDLLDYSSLVKLLNGSLSEDKQYFKPWGNNQNYIYPVQFYNTALKTTNKYGVEAINEIVDVNQKQNSDIQSLQTLINTINPEIKDIDDALKLKVNQVDFDNTLKDYDKTSDVDAKLAKKNDIFYFDTNSILKGKESGTYYATALTKAGTNSYLTYDQLVNKQDKLDANLLFNILSNNNVDGKRYYAINADNQYLFPQDFYNDSLKTTAKGGTAAINELFDLVNTKQGTLKAGAGIAIGTDNTISTTTESGIKLEDLDTNSLIQGDVDKKVFATALTKAGSNTYITYDQVQAIITKGDSLQAQIGDLSQLQTNVKDSIVNAINELKGDLA